MPWRAALSRSKEVANVVRTPPPCSSTAPTRVGSTIGKSVPARGPVAMRPLLRGRAASAVTRRTGPTSSTAVATP